MGAVAASERRCGDLRTCLRRIPACMPTCMRMRMHCCACGHVFVHACPRLCTCLRCPRCRSQITTHTYAHVCVHRCYMRSYRITCLVKAADMEFGETLASADIPNACLSACKHACPYPCLYRARLCLPRPAEQAVRGSAKWTAAKPHANCAHVLASVHTSRRGARMRAAVAARARAFVRPRVQACLASML